MLIIYRKKKIGYHLKEKSRMKILLCVMRKILFLMNINLFTWTVKSLIFISTIAINQLK